MKRKFLVLLTSLVFTTIALGQERPEVSVAGADGIQFDFAPISVTEDCYVDILKGTARKKGTFYLIPPPLVSIDRLHKPIVYFSSLDKKNINYSFKLGIYIPWNMKSEQQENKNLLSLPGNFLQTRPCSPKEAIKIHNTHAKSGEDIEVLTPLPIEDIEVEIESIGKRKRIGNDETRFLNIKGRDQLVSFAITKEEAEQIREEIIDGGIAIKVHYHFAARSSAGYIKGSFKSENLATSLETEIRAKDNTGLVGEGTLKAAINNLIHSDAITLEQEESKSEYFNEIANRFVDQFFTQNERFLTEVTPVRTVERDEGKSEAQYSLQAVVNYARSIKTNSFEYSMATLLQSSVVTTTMNFQASLPDLNTRNYVVPNDLSTVIPGEEWIKVNVPAGRTAKVNFKEYVKHKMQAGSKVISIQHFDKKTINDQQVYNYFNILKDNLSALTEIKAGSDFTGVPDSGVIARFTPPQSVFKNFDGSFSLKNTRYEWYVWGSENFDPGYKKGSSKSIGEVLHEVGNDLTIKFSNSWQTYTLNDIINKTKVLPEGATIVVNSQSGTMTVKFASGAQYIQFKNTQKFDNTKVHTKTYFQHVYKRKTEFSGTMFSIVSPIPGFLTYDHYIRLPEYNLTKVRLEDHPNAKSFFDLEITVK